MPYGSGQVARMALMHAKPWQRYVIHIAMIGGGDRFGLDGPYRGHHSVLCGLLRGLEDDHVPAKA